MDNKVSAEITLEEQIHQMANQRYTPIGQAILDSLEQLLALRSRQESPSEDETFRNLAIEARWLRKAANEIAKEGHNGWGNTCAQAADAIDRAIQARGRK